MEQKLDKIKYIKRVIIVCWVALAICFLIKLFGGNFFQIICENQTFIAICEFCEKNIAIYCIVACISSIINTTIMDLAICCKTKFNLCEFLILAISVCVGAVFKILVNRTTGMIFDVVNLIILPCIFSIKTPRRHWFAILGNALLIIFQLISMFVKNISFGFVASNGMLISIIYSIDVIIMLVLYYLYANLLRLKKERSENG